MTVGRPSEMRKQEGLGEHVEKEMEELRGRVLESERVRREAERSLEEAVRELEQERMRLEQAVRRAREDGSVRLAALEDSVRSLASRSNMHEVHFPPSACLADVLVSTSPLCLSPTIPPLSLYLIA